MRKNGVLLPISSLPSNYGIGTLGQAAYNFVDFLKKGKQAYWQILPVGPTSYGDSPYQSYSTFAGNPYFIDLDLLAKDGLLDPADFANEVWYSSPEYVDYGLQYNKRFPVLRKAAENFLKNPEEGYAKFLEENADWLPDYALYMALKDANGGRPWLEWDESIKKYDAKKADELREEYKEDVAFYEVLQYLFFKQFKALKEYANKQGVKIIGDVPIYVAMDSADAWSNPEIFALDKDGRPEFVGGCPPDGFSADGQLWGNPLYNWKTLKERDYDWWVKRVDALTQMYDVLRIDHFRGFDSYYAIPFGDTNAKNGTWQEGPGMDLFHTITNALGERDIIAEDLGFLTPSVRKLLKDSGYPGMKVLEFAFDSRDAANNDYLPFNYPKNSVAYIGTHDNDTIMGWLNTAPREDAEMAVDFINCKDLKDFNWDMIRTLMASPADTTVIQAQDLLGLGTESRINEPSTVGKNWQWRLKDGEQLNDELAEKLAHLTDLYGRTPETAVEAKEETKDADESAAVEETEDCKD